MKPRPLYLLTSVLLVVIGLCGGYLFRRTSSVARPATPAPRFPEVQTAAALAPSAAPALAPAPVALPPLAQALEGLLDLLSRGIASAADLSALKAQLMAADPREAMAAIRNFLRSGRDAGTGQSFALAAGGGALSGAPTLRTFLLDLLGQIGRKTGGDVAGQISREVLAQKSSADEWALALRNVAWTEPRARPFLTDKVREMLAYEPWRAAPSDGMLEGLDVVVFNHDASLIPDLAAAHSANRELAHATDIAMDRLADAAPLDVMTYLNTHPAVYADRPLMRADYFAKADLGQPAQRAQVEIYLGRPDIPLEEKGKLLKELTAPASFVSDTLVAAPASADDGSARRAGLVLASSEWLKSDRFPALRAPLTEIQQRLAGTAP